MPRYESVWIATSEEPGFGALEAPIEVDVAVLGAGIAGLTTALLLKNAGLRVAVVEAAGVSRATTGHTTAKVSAQHGLIYDTLSSKFGNDGARAYGQANLAAVDLVEALVREHGIACDWERRAAYAYTEQHSQVSQIEREVDAARQAGLPASYTEETDLPWSVKAAVRFDNQAQFHPRRYCLALATLVDGDGSRVFEQTRPTSGRPSINRQSMPSVRIARRSWSRWTAADSMNVTARKSTTRSRHPSATAVEMASRRRGTVARSLAVGFDHESLALRSHMDLEGLLVHQEREASFGGGARARRDRDPGCTWFAA